MNKNGAETRLSGQRKAVEDHVNKYNTYEHRDDKNYALKTINNAQGHIASIKEKFPNTSDSKWDKWKP